jgi:hypothetical protein
VAREKPSVEGSANNEAAVSLASSVSLSLQAAMIKKQTQQHSQKYKMRSTIILPAMLLLVK